MCMCRSTNMGIGPHDANAIFQYKGTWHAMHQANWTDWAHLVSTVELPFLFRSFSFYTQPIVGPCPLESVAFRTVPQWRLGWLVIQKRHMGEVIPTANY